MNFSAFSGDHREVNVIKLVAKPARHSYQPAQVAAICYRVRRASIEFLLVNTSSGKWTFPKGRLDPKLSASEAAAREALEEAGASGKIEASHFDSYLDTKRVFGEGYQSCEIRIGAYLLEVESIADPEEADRNPTWFSPDEAKERLSQRRLPKYSNDLARIVDHATRMVARQKPGDRLAYQGQRRATMFQ
ncbi:MAG TPA: NUDIX domain-containing protein [Candidatus Solibacter sp.]|nr:NUDIX domain-containing protein [Candidatus Solibacter sp.]